MPPYRYSFMDEEEEDPFSFPYRSLNFNQAAPVAPIAPQQNGLADFYSQLANLQSSPEHQSYLEWLKRTPKEKDYAASKGTRLASTLIAGVQGFLGRPEQGLETAERIVRSPYERAIRRHDIEERGLKAAADLSRQSMDDRIQLLNNIEQSKVRQQNFELQRQNIQSQMAKREIDSKTALLNQQKIENDLRMQGFQKVEDKVNGTVSWKNPWTGESTAPYKIDESVPEATSRKRADFSFEEKERRTTQGIQREDTQRHQETMQEDAQTHAKDLEGVRQTNREVLAKIRSGQRSQSNINQIRSNEQSARSLIATNPKEYGEVATVQPNGDISTVAPHRTREPDLYAKYVAVHNKLYKGIEGTILLSMPPGYDEFGNKVAEKPKGKILDVKPDTSKGPDLDFDK